MTNNERVEYITIKHALRILANMHGANEFKIAELLKDYLGDEKEYKNIVKIMKKELNKLLQ